MVKGQEVTLRGEKVSTYVRIRILVALRSFSSNCPVPGVHPVWKQAVWGLVICVSDLEASPKMEEVRCRDY